MKIKSIIKSLRKKEIQSLSGQNDYGEFSNRLKSIVQYHKKTPLNETATISVPISVEYDNLVKLIQSHDDDAGGKNNLITIEIIILILKFHFFYCQAFVNFTDEEGFGKYLDLNELYQKFVNLKGVEVGF